MNDIVCKIYDYELNKEYDGIILNNKVYLLDEEGEPIYDRDELFSLTCCYYKVGIFFIDEKDFREIGENRKNYKWGYFNSITGEIMVDPIYDGGAPFYGELACINIDKKYGMIDLKGREVIEPVYEFVDIKFVNKMCVVKKQGKFGYINSKNEAVIDFKYEFATELLTYEDKEMNIYFYAIIKINGKYGMINEEGEYILAPIYEDLKQTFFYDTFVLKLNGKYGFIKLYNGKGEDGIKIEYLMDHIFDELGGRVKSNIIKGEKEFFCMKKDSKYAIINNKFEIHYSKPEKKYVQYKDKKIIIYEENFGENAIFNFRRFRTMGFA